MFYPSIIAVLVMATTVIFSPQVLALDARTAALGGSAIANAKGGKGALQNPAALMQMRRNQQSFHFHMGVSADLRDNAEYIDAATEIATIPDEIEEEIDLLTGKALLCVASLSTDSVCVTDTEVLGELSTNLLDLLEQVDEQPISAALSADLSMAYTRWSIPVAVHFRYTATGAAEVSVAQFDRDYIGVFESVFTDGELTLGEVFESIGLGISEDGESLTIVQPEDALQSGIEGSALLRAQFGISMATTVPLAGQNFDIGITPKFSILGAASLSTVLSDTFDDDTPSLPEQFEDNENTTSSWTIDIGASTRLKHFPITVSGVARNLVRESIITDENFEFETTPQFIVGAALDQGALTFTADIALNKAKVDNLDTQIAAVGVEWSRSFVALRAGIGFDNARTKDATALSLGFSLGPLHIGGRLSNRTAAQAGAQLAFSF